MVNPWMLLGLVSTFTFYGTYLFFLGVMVFEALYPSLNLSDELIQRISGIFDTNAIEIRKGDRLFKH